MSDPGGPLHRTSWDAESWRWFEPVDVSVVDEMVVLAFRWLDPSTPDIVYVAVAHVDGLSRESAAVLVARQQFRRLLAAGWREEVERTWLATRKVLVRRPAQQRHPERQAEIRELIWNQRRDAD